MIDLKLDLPFSFKPEDETWSIRKDLNKKKLFDEIRTFLDSKGVSRSRYSLGVIDGDDVYGLVNYDGYWFVTYTERGSHVLMGLFSDFHSAVNFLVWELSGSDSIKWSKVFDD